MNYGRIIAWAPDCRFPHQVWSSTVSAHSGLQAIADATAKVSRRLVGCYYRRWLRDHVAHPHGREYFRPNPDWAFDGSMPNVYVSMGITAENVAANYNISREDMDKFGLESNRRASEAIKAGKI